MLALAPTQWALVALAVILYVITCVRMARHMKRIGRNAVLWFFLTFFLTAIPGSIVLLHHNFCWLRRRNAGAGRQVTGPGENDSAPPRRCRHCGELVDPPAARPGGVSTCPSCGQMLDEANLA